MANAKDAKTVIEALHDVLGVRTCTTRLPKNPRDGSRGCLLGDLGGCVAPCRNGDQTGYSSVIDSLRFAIEEDPSPVVEALAERIAYFAAKQEYERAATLRDGVSAFVQGAVDAQYFGALRRATIVAARPEGSALDVAAIAHGRLCETRRLIDPTPADIAHATSALLETASSEHVTEIPLVEEQQIIASWLNAQDARLLGVEGKWAQPIRGAARHVHWVTARQDDRARVWDTASVSGRG
jgi:DNA polymerase-3 subunit epsilon